MLSQYIPVVAVQIVAPQLHAVVAAAALEMVPSVTEQSGRRAHKQRLDEEHKTFEGIFKCGGVSLFSLK